jgi:hypothetical protein
LSLALRFEFLLRMVSRFLASSPHCFPGNLQVHGMEKMVMLEAG